ncbi:hypothetical protein COU95_02720 [Candidatus Shapirobacteria bacterium CG10_big_fil_rev_8_21_14_0_10_40_9]|uniref:Transposase IS200-like domain-containing protein n=1 Tax=Candidatus Shapirobacteria bacterium CG10_big_fil_rev_8_21_14_0_10_40_9 TaxID=1974888 RepID=A0A2M8L3A4_9BACT|nr:MAG: hypothetical protein COU95_02720 [Candidatus Shapirobacteria bacterium CG10_big_fil_rev_8_21_14_0_10_40_9]
MRRKQVLATGEVYHIFSRSIANFEILNNASEFERMLELLNYYNYPLDTRFSHFLEMQWVQQMGFYKSLDTISKDKDQLVQVIAYCLMPTHIHLILKQLKENGISDYMRKVLDGYTKYFNAIHKRKGPLWESKFQNVLVDNDDQLIHLTRYLHLNPVTARLVEKPEDWIFSSYREYLGSSNNSFCQFDDLLDIKPHAYRKFVNDQVSYQRELAKIKRLIVD